MATKVVEDVKMVGEWRVSPPVGSVPPTGLRLSYFDVPMLSVQVEYLLFFDFLGSAQDFRDGHFPILRRSLSLALSLFYPVAGRLVLSPDSNYPAGEPVIRYSEGDFVTLTLAESCADFSSLVGNQAKEAEAFHPLVPPLHAVNLTSLISTETKHGSVVVPLMAFQVTVFPGSGFSVGLKFNHVVTDGFGCIRFLKSWAAISKAGGTDVSAVRETPVFDRALLGGDHEPVLKRTLLAEEVAAEIQRRRRRLANDLITESLEDDTSRLAESSEDDPSRLTESSEDDLNHDQKPAEPQQKSGRMTRGTFVLKRAHMETLRRKVELSCFRTTNYYDLEKVGPLMISTYSATCAFVWACLAKSRPLNIPTAAERSDQTLYFWIPADFRRRLRPPVPGSYFGNVSPVSAVVEVSHAELTGENGVVSASRAIQLAIRRMDERRVLECLPSVIRRFKEVMGSKPRERRFSIAGSHRFRAYDIDFGWGRPRKIEFPSIETTELVSLSDCRDEEGGVEIGFGGPEKEMLRFSSFFEEGLKLGLCDQSKL